MECHVHKTKQCSVDLTCCRVSSLYRGITKCMQGQWTPFHPAWPSPNIIPPISNPTPPSSPASQQAPALALPSPSPPNPNPKPQNLPWLLNTLARESHLCAGYQVAGRLPSSPTPERRRWQCCVPPCAAQSASVCRRCQTSAAAALCHLPVALLMQSPVCRTANCRPRTKSHTQSGADRRN